MRHILKFDHRKKLGGFSFKVKLFLIIVALILAVGLLLFKWGFGTVRKVNVVKNGPISACFNEFELKARFNLEGKNIFLINTQNIESKITNKYLCIKSVVVKKQYPKEVSLILDGREPVAQIVNAKSPLKFANLEATPSSSSTLLDWTISHSTPSSFLLVDGSGLIFAQTKTLGSPLVYWFNKELKIGDRLDKDIFDKMLTSFTKVKELGIFITRAKIVDDILITESSIKMAFSLKNDILKQLASLQLILQKAKIGEETIETIDLRFDKPVVIYGKR